MLVRVPVVWVEVSDMETKAPDTVKVEANEALVVLVLEISTTLPVMLGVVTAVE